MLLVQVALCLFTAGAFVAAWHYANIAADQKTVMELQSLIMNQAFVETRRQGLSVERSAEAAISAANTATNALRSSNDSFTKTIAEMEKQTSAQQIAATTQEKQLNVALEQARANLEIKNFAINYSNDFHTGNAKVTFDLVNEGASTATAIAVTGDDSGRFNPTMSIEDNFAATARTPEVDPAGFSLDKGDPPKHFEMDATGWIQIRQRGVEWFGWRRFTYLNIFGETDSTCVLVVASKAGLHSRPCLPTKPQQKR